MTGMYGQALYLTDSSSVCHHLFIVSTRHVSLFISTHHVVKNFLPLLQELIFFFEFWYTEIEIWFWPDLHKLPGVSAV
jgi:hypothetical protein